MSDNHPITCEQNARRATFAAELTSAAYPLVLRRGRKGSWIQAVLKMASQGLARRRMGLAALLVVGLTASEARAFPPPVGGPPPMGGPPMGGPPMMRPPMMGGPPMGGLPMGRPPMGGMMRPPGFGQPPMGGMMRPPGMGTPFSGMPGPSPMTFRPPTAPGATPGGPGMGRPPGGGPGGHPAPPGNAAHLSPRPGEPGSRPAPGAGQPGSWYHPRQAESALNGLAGRGLVETSARSWMGNAANAVNANAINANAVNANAVNANGLNGRYGDWYRSAGYAYQAGKGLNQLYNENRAWNLADGLAAGAYGYGGGYGSSGDSGYGYGSSGDSGYGYGSYGDSGYGYGSSGGSGYGYASSGDSSSSSASSGDSGSGSGDANQNSDPSSSNAGGSSQVAAQNTDPDAVSPEERGSRAFDKARDAFKTGDYAAALDLTDEALKDMPRDPVVHEFKALALFARGEYAQAAAELHTVLSVTPGMDWRTMSGLYPDVETYTGQLRALEDRSRREPKAAAPRLVLAHHYLVAGHKDAAVAQLKALLDAKPDDRLSRRLLALLNPTPPASTEPTRTASDGDGAAARPPADVIGRWRGDRDGSTFDLSLDGSGRFVWHAARKGKAAANVSGAYSLSGDTLTLKGDDRSPLRASVTSLAADSFRFKTAADAPSGPGLVFRRVTTPEAPDRDQHGWPRTEKGAGL